MLMNPGRGGLFMDAGCFLNREKETDSVNIFLHMPRSGGTTFSEIIQKQYHSNICIWKASVLDGFFCNLNDLTTEEQKRIEIIYGHMFFGVHKRLPQTNFTYITFIRDPIERVISNYYFCRDCIIDMNLRNLFNNMTLYDYATSTHWNLNNDMGYWPGSTVNLQTRMLAGNTEDDLETAKYNLKNYFSVVGTTERYDETLKVLQRKLDWDIGDFKKRNVVPNRPALEEVPDEIIGIIKSKNEKDVALHQFANQLLDEQLHSL